MICVAAGSYPTTTLTVSKAVTVRANGVVTLKNIVITGSNAVVDGFNVVGGTLGNPNYAIKFSGTGHKIINNLVRGRGICYAIGCEQSAGCGTNVLIAGNTITGVHNFGIYLWGGDRITVEKNNVFDLFQSTDVDDVDAMRAWGTNHVVRNNYFHDINGRRAPARRTATVSRRTRPAAARGCPATSSIENNYCVRVTGQCVIVQNDLRNAAELKDYVIRGNVCETYGWQSIEIDRRPGRHDGQQLRRRGADDRAELRERRGRQPEVDQLQGPQHRAGAGDRRNALLRRRRDGEQHRQHGEPDVRRPEDQDVVRRLHQPGHAVLRTGQSRPTSTGSTATACSGRPRR